jgi:transposase
MSTWPWTELTKLGLPVVCIDARHAKAALKMQINKSDRNDAMGIARIMQCGWYKEVRVKDLDSRVIRRRTPTVSAYRAIPGSPQATKTGTRKSLSACP